MSGFQPDEIVNVTVEGARVQKEDARWLDCLLGAYRLTVPLDGPGVTVERVAPAEWPPQPGDLWRNRKGELWFAADVHDPELTDEADVVMVFPYENYREKPALLNHREGPLTLVRREGSTS